MARSSRALQKKPENRLPTAGELVDALAADRDIVTGVIYKPLDALEVDRLIQQSLRAATA